MTSPAVARELPTVSYGDDGDAPPAPPGTDTGTVPEFARSGAS